LKGGGRATVARKSEVDFAALHFEPMAKIRCHSDRIKLSEGRLRSGIAPRLLSAKQVNLAALESAWLPYAVVKGATWYELGELNLNNAT
jgi:hypothetical protein